MPRDEKKTHKHRHSTSVFLLLFENRTKLHIFTHVAELPVEHFCCPSGLTLIVESLMLVFFRCVFFSLSVRKTPQFKSGTHKSRLFSTICCALFLFINSKCRASEYARGKRSMLCRKKFYYCFTCKSNIDGCVMWCFPSFLTLIVRKIYNFEIIFF